MLHVFQSLLSCNCTHLEISFTPKYPYFCVNNIFMLLGAIVIFLKLTFSIVYIITIQSLVKTKLKVFRSFISMLYKVHKIHAVMYRCIILVINSGIFCIYMYYTYFSWEAIWEDKQFLMIPYLIGRNWINYPS